MEEKSVLKKGKINDDIKSHETDKKVGELLSLDLNKIKDKFKAKDNGEQLLLSADESFEEYKKEYEKSLEYSIPKIEPIGSTVITTCMISNIMDFGKFLIGAEFDAKLVKQFKSATSDRQIVVAKGPNCRQVEVGDEISIRLADFYRIKNPNSVQSQEVTELPIEEIDGEKYLSINEGNIRHIYQNDTYFKNRKG